MRRMMHLIITVFINIACRVGELVRGCTEEGAVYVMPAFDMVAEEFGSQHLAAADRAARGAQCTSS